MPAASLAPADLLLSPRRRWLLAAGAGSVAALGAAAWLGKPSAAAVAQRQGESMGSTWQLRLAGTDADTHAADAAQAAVQRALDAVEQRMTSFDARSDIGRFNADRFAESVVMDADTLAVLAAGQAVAQASSGAFDMTVAPLVGAWGFGAAASGRGGAPSAEQLAAPVGWQHLQVDRVAGHALRRVPGLQLDLSAIAKGHAVDAAAGALDALGLQHWMVEAGGEVRTRGHNGAGRPWQIAIEQPDAWPPRPRRVVPMAGGAMATSGDYRNFYALGERRIHHEIDPRSRAPAAHRLASVSVVHARCREADAWATALFVMGPEQGMALARDQGLAALFVLRAEGGGFRDLASPAFEALA